MEKSILVFSFLLLGFVGFSQDNPREFEMTEGDTTYTMKQYMFCLYLSGQNKSQTDEERSETQVQHMAHINEMVETKNLQVAGPFGDDTEKRGILIFDLKTLEEANEAVAADPAVKAGKLDFECHPIWLAKGTTLH